MPITHQLAKHLRDVYFGGNWSTSNLKDNLKDLTWEQATMKIGQFNTIAMLVQHATYYVAEVTKVLEGGALVAKDELSFEHPPITNQADWEAFLAQKWKEAEHFANLIEQLPDSILEGDFTDSKYGSYFRNINGIIEHLHYHLGQIAVIKRLI